LKGSKAKIKIGVLALQGAFIEHARILQQLGAKASLVRLPKELDGLDGLVIPGGESTTISRLMADFHLMQPLRDLAQAGLPILGTCAGMILLAKDVGGNSVPSLGAMDIRVKRNAFGRQVDSFETDIEIPALGAPPFHAIFIRAPIVEKVGPDVEVLARLSDGIVVAARQGKLVALAFHPELTSDPRFHRYFLEIAASA
jgi:5'-phosphate synthase pdxT subunit